MKHVAASNVTALAAAATAVAITVAAAQTARGSTDHAPHQIHTLRLPDATLEYLDFGGPNGAPALVLLPGYGNSAHIYDDIAPGFWSAQRPQALVR